MRNTFFVNVDIKKIKQVTLCSKIQHLLLVWDRNLLD